jgi:hypothetical protein
MRMSGKSRLGKAVVLTVVAASFSLIAEQAFASEFKPEAATYWVIRTRHMAEVTTKNLNAGAESKADKIANADTLRASMIEACAGLQSEQMSHEYGKVPRWALGAQLTICTAMERWGGKGFMTSRVPCRDMEKGIQSLEMAKPGDDPADVVEAAASLKATAQLLLEVAKAKDDRLQLRCSYSR